MLSIFKQKQFQNIAFCQLNTTLSTTLLVPILPVFLARKGFAESQIGLIMGAAALSALIVRPWVGLQVDRRGSRPVLMLGQVLLLLSIIGLLWAESIGSFLGLRLAYGVALAFYGTGAVTFASGIGVGKANASAIAMYTLMTMIGLGASMSLAQTLYDHFGFSTLVLITSALLGTAFCVMKFRAKAFDVTAKKDGKVPFVTVLKDKVVLAVSVGQFGSSFAFGAVFTYVPLAAIQGGTSFYSFFFIAFAVTVVISRFFVQRIIDMLGMERTCLYAYLAMLVGVLPLVFDLSPPVLVVTGLSFGAGFGVTFPAFILLLVQRLNAARRGTSLGILIAAGDIAIALSAAIMGTIAEHLGYVHLFLATTVTLAVCMYFLHTLILTGSANSESAV